MFRMYIFAKYTPDEKYITVLERGGNDTMRLPTVFIF